MFTLSRSSLRSVPKKSILAPDPKPALLTGEEPANWEDKAVSPEADIPGSKASGEFPIASEQAFEAFYLENLERCIAWAQKVYKGPLVPDSDSASDLVHEALSRLFEKRQSIHTNPFWQFTREVADVVLYREKRRLGHLPPGTAADPLLGKDQKARATDSIYGSKELRVHFQDAKDRLPGELRYIYDLRMMGEGNAAIAKLLGIPTSRVQDQFEKACNEIQSRIRKLSETAAGAEPVFASRQRLRGRDSVEKALRDLPKLLSEILTALHLRNLSLDAVVTSHRLASIEEARQLLAVGYRLLEKRFDQDMPHALVEALRHSEEKG